ncbi:MAG: glycosyltransferase [Bacteroidales bacterium]|nr:glycosyltransferase [Bacteroidales bacterium]
MINPNKIIIITTCPFPNGLAGTNRILSYCKGFLYHGYQPEVFCIRPTEPYYNSTNLFVKGTFNGIKYTYPGGTTKRVASFLGRRKNDFYAKWASLRLLYKTLKKGEIFFIIFYGNSVVVELSSILISRRFNIKIYKEESENPEIYFRGVNIFNSFKKWFVINKLYGYYTGILVMTHPLKKLFLGKGIPNRNILIIPQTVDQERFEKDNYNTSVPRSYDYIAYVGSLNQLKDGVLTLVESFEELSAIYSEIHLVIAGDGTPKEKEELILLIKKLKLPERVHYIGCIQSSDIPAFLKGAKLLVSCRPKSLQSDFGFPTKITEYLATGRPIVTTLTGELDLYLKDRVNVFATTTDDRNSFASKIIEVLEDYDFAMKVARRGQMLISDNFNPIIQTKRIIDFCTD